MDDTTVRDTPGKAEPRRGNNMSRISSQAAVAELGQAALGALTLNQVFELSLTLVCDALDVEFAKILHQRAPNAPLVVVATHGWDDSIEIGVTTVPSDPGSQAGYTLATKEPVLLNDLASERRFTSDGSLATHNISSGISVVIPDKDRPYGVLNVHTRQPRPFTTEDGDFLRSIANVIGGSIQNQRARNRIAHQSETQERRLRYQTALAECAQSLLRDASKHSLDDAARALLTATQATYVLVERNRVDPELGLCSETVAEVEKADAPSSQLRNAYWDLVPWDKMPISRSRLEAGQPVVIIPDQLTGIEREHYAADPIPVTSELNIPIFVNGSWEGLIGFSETTVVREWTAEDISLLTTAATMIGAFWEREAASDDRERLLRTKDQFLASVSHELRTPLTAVVGFGEILRDTGHLLSETERHEFLELLVAQGSDVTNIVNDLLVAAKADIGSLNVTRVTVNLRAQTAQVLEAFNRDDRARIDLIGAPNVKAMGDPDRIRQVIRNLITNSLRYGGDKVQVEVVNTQRVGVVVRDNGPAIPDEDRERIFQPYQRAHNAPGVAGSLGLGLAISRRLARLMDGDLVYRHQHGHSIFELMLPEAS